MSGNGGESVAGITLSYENDQKNSLVFDDVLILGGLQTSSMFAHGISLSNKGGVLDLNSSNLSIKNVLGTGFDLLNQEGSLDLNFSNLSMEIIGEEGVHLSNHDRASIQLEKSEFRFTGGQGAFLLENQANAFAEVQLEDTLFTDNDKGLVCLNMEKGDLNVGVSKGTFTRSAMSGLSLTGMGLDSKTTLFLESCSFSENLIGAEMNAIDAGLITLNLTDSTFLNHSNEDLFLMGTSQGKVSFNLQKSNFIERIVAVASSGFVEEVRTDQDVVLKNEETEMGTGDNYIESQSIC